MKFRIVDAWYTKEDEGYRQTMPVVHLIVRDQQWERHHIPIAEFRPYFCVSQDEWVLRGEEVADDDRVVSVDTEDLRGRPETGIDGDPLIRVVCREPGDVKDLRIIFEEPYEADVLFPVRFLVDVEAKQWIEIDDEAVAPIVESDGETAREDVISLEAVSLSVENEPDQTPPVRVCTYDIEVRQGGRGPPVVSTEGTEQAQNPITAISAHDNYTDEYRLWLLAHDDWAVDDAEAARSAVEADVTDVSIYRNPKTLAGLFCEHIVERGYDALMGWNASTFDHPYFVNYCLQNNISSVYDLSPTRQVYDMDGDGQFINGSLKGRLLLDLMKLYDKTTVSELDSKRLVDVAASEDDVDVDKLSIEDAIDVPDGEPAIDYARREHPDVFAEYSLRDTQAAVAINEDSKEEVSIV